MQFPNIFFTAAVLVLIVAADQNQNHHRNPYFQEKTHQIKIQQKSATNNFVNRQRISESRSFSPHHLHRLIYKNGNGNCSWTCQNGSNAIPHGLEVLYSEDAGLVGLLNQSSNTALVIDYSTNIAALLIGRTGGSIVVDLNSGSIYNISSETQNNITWVATKSNFDTYFHGLSSLQSLLAFAKANGQKYKFYDVAHSVLNEIITELDNLGFLKLSKAIIDVISPFIPYNIINYVARLISSVVTFFNKILSRIWNAWGILSEIPIIGNFFTPLNITRYLSPKYVNILLNGTNNSEIISKLLPGVDLNNITSIELFCHNLPVILSNSSNVWSIFSSLPTGTFEWIIGTLPGNIWNTANAIASDVGNQFSGTFWETISGVTFSDGNTVDILWRICTKLFGSSPGFGYGFQISERNGKPHKHHQEKGKKAHHKLQEKKQQNDNHHVHRQ